MGGSLLVGVISLQLLLKSQDLLISFIQAPSQRDHDVTLLQQQLLVPIYLQHTSEDVSVDLCLVRRAASHPAFQPNNNRAAAQRSTPCQQEAGFFLLLRGSTPVFCGELFRLVYQHCFMLA